MIWLRETVAILRCILGIKSHNWLFCFYSNLFLFFWLEIISKWIGKSRFGFDNIFFVFLDDIWVTSWRLCWFEIIFRVRLICCYGSVWILERIKRKRSMNFSFGYIRIRIVIILWFGLNDFDLFLIHKIEGIFKLSGWNRKEKYLLVS